MQEIIRLTDGRCVLIAFAQHGRQGKTYAAEVLVPEGLFPPQHLRKCDAYGLWRAGLFLEETDGLKGWKGHEHYAPEALPEDLQSLTTVLGQGISLLKHLQQGRPIATWERPTPEQTRDLFRSAHAFVEDFKFLMGQQTGEAKEAPDASSPLPERWSMKEYKHNYQRLMELLGDQEHIRIENEPYMPLTVEKLGGQPFISLCHYRPSEQGDLLRDPEVVFQIHEGTARGVYFLQDHALEHATIRGHFGDVPVKPHLQKSLDGFCRVWLENIEHQGFFERAKELRAKQTTEQESVAVELKSYVVQVSETWTFTDKIRVEATSPEEAEKFANKELETDHLSLHDGQRLDSHSKALTENDRQLERSPNREAERSPELDNEPEMEP